MAEHVNTGVCQLRRQLFPISRQKLSSDQEGAVAVGGGTQPSVESEVHALSYRAHSNEQHGQAGLGVTRCFARVVDSFIVAIQMTHQLRGLKALIDEGTESEIRRAK